MILFKKFLIYKKTVITAAVIGCIVIGGIGYWYSVKGVEVAAADTTYKEVRAQMGDITIDIEEDGAASISVVNLDFQISGKVKEILVEVGQEVKKGQVLAKLDDTEYVKKLQSADMDYKKSKLRLEQTISDNELKIVTEKQNIEDAKRKYNQLQSQYSTMIKNKDQYKDTEISQKKVDVENAKTAYNSQLSRYNLVADDKKSIEMEKLNVESAKIAYEMAKENLDHTILKASNDAKVVSIAYKEGETVQNTNHFMELSSNQNIEVIAAIPETEMSKIQKEQPVEVKFEAVEGKTFTGKVASIDQKPNTDNSGLVTYNVLITLSEQDSTVKTGMTCEVSFIIKKKKNILFIPNKAITIKDGKQIVSVKKQNSEIEIREIQTGFTEGKNAEILSGLKVGETVLVETKTTK